MTQALPLFIGHEIYRGSSYGRHHPLGIPRVSSCIDLSRALGWLPPVQYRDSPQATPEQLARFHTPDYIAAVMRAEAAQFVPEEERARYNLGVNNNPVFAEMFRRPATAAGGSIRAAELVRSGGVAYHPAGGTHHGRRAQAHGFCFFNDPVLGILALLDQGLDRIFYLDLDAHHGDGVQEAFADDPRVFTVSVHEERRWPHSGLLDDRAGGAARNLPVPAGLNDDEMAFLVAEAFLPLAQGFKPQAVMIQGGADALSDDPQSRLSLSNNALWDAVTAFRGLAERLIVLGGGGYNPWSVARCWTGIWGRLNDHWVPDRLPPEAEAVLRGLSWDHRRGRNPPEEWFTTLADPPHRGPIRDEIRVAARAVSAPALCGSSV